MKKLTLLTFFVIGALVANAQSQSGRSLGSLSSFKDKLSSQMASSKSRTDKQELEATLPEGSIDLKVNFFSESEQRMMLAGNVADIDEGTFFIHATTTSIKGNIILKEQKLAYEYVLSDGEVIIRSVDIDKVLCVSYPQGNSASGNQRIGATAALNDLQSLPGAATCVLLDFDGYYLPAGTGWMNGNAWNAPASGMSDAQVQEAWDLISEDFRPFNVNITTNESVYNSYPQGSRQRCVFTPSDAPAPGAGGVAYVGGFGYQDWPCWVFIMAGKAGGEAGAHEIGHTVGLGHDGRTNPNEGYFAGHADWAPIMGVGYYRNITQWSRGEYAYANNTENDLNIMSGYIGYRGDDHSNGTGGATYIPHNGSGNITMQYGVIQSTGDVDMFSFNCGTGNITLNVNTVDRHGDLDILVRLYEGGGNQIGVFNGSGLNTTVNAYLDAGTYYLSVDGTGAGNPATDGYSDYASLGSFWISGNVTPGSAGVATLYQHCNYGGYAVNLNEGSYDVGQLQSLGVVNDDISSIRVTSGYRAILFWDGGFQGATVTKTGDDACLVDDGFNDQASAVVIEKVVASTAIEAESYSTMNGVQLESCSEGGQNVGWIDANDWMAYNGINFPGSGNYLVEYRVASASGGGRLSVDLNGGNILLGELDIPNTGGWQNWTTISHTVNVNAGNYSVGIFAQAGGWNLNWFKITQQGTGAGAGGQQQALARSEADHEFDFNLYPNPAVDMLKLTIPNDWAKSSGRIIDIQGAILWDAELNGNRQHEIDVSKLSKGIYTLILNQGSETVFKRFIKE